MNRSIVAGAAVVTLALSGAGVAAAAGGDPSPQEGGPAPSANARTLAGVSSCHGGKQKRSLTKTNRTPYTFGEGSDVLLPGMRMEVKGPKRGKDTLNVAFSGETQLRGVSTGDRYDWMEVEVLVDGTPIQPFGPASDPYAFNGSPEYGSHAAQFCARLGRGKHLVEVRSRLVDNGNADSLTSWVDDTTLHAVVSD